LMSESSQLQQLKLLWKGKRLIGESLVFVVPPKKTPKIMVLSTELSTVQELNAKRSDPTIRGFDQERSMLEQKKMEYWGPDTAQDKNYKFCRFQACTWQSFGHRPSDSTPHDFEALHLLEKLATDPGIVAVLKERELVVGTLGEMDPIDDRLMQKTQQQQGACLLGYNTNGGARIDIKLRTDDLRGFRPYAQIAATLLHELSHNWVGEHNLLFWTNYAQMRVEYVVAHAFQSGGNVVNGKTTAQLAGLTSFCGTTLDEVYEFVVNDLVVDMAQHGLHPSMIASAIRDRCNELEGARVTSGRQLGGNTMANSSNPREMALQAAERRRAKKDKEKKSSNR
jgi:hypothetical protein